MEFGFPAETDLGEWTSEHANGRRPDALPYGMNRLRDSGIDLVTSALPRLSAPDKGRLLAGLVSRDASPDWSIAWDEHAALRLRAGGHGERFAFGVVWATERDRGALARARAGAILRMLGTPDLVWVTSDAQLEPLRKMVGPRVRVEFLQFGVDTDFFVGREQPQEPAVLSVGNDADRDIPTLLSALSIVHGERPEVALRVQFTGDLAVPAGVTRLPLMSHAALREEYARASVVAVATRPNLHISGLTATLEAMSTGRAVVVTDRPGVQRYVGHDRWGLLSEPGSADALASNILSALDPARGARLGAAGRRAAVEEFNTATMASQLAVLLSGHSF
ncbi:glycosyltransferase family 4 protein [Cryobacterium sp. SO2]|uniref:glycosyltransferase family 4 protein n=1 Tax=Cryobacterium sp. SO2 TaxID=1897060 RepID=UPI00223CFA1F|nr:glycosyltransferase family 4 protein [Cryobacterium sp. SO2]WEO76922.1 glycosyltransferase family 4 protein [Cryobacterium sp. SO2]